jgi:hypothetical protein
MRLATSEIPKTLPYPTINANPPFATVTALCTRKPYLMPWLSGIQATALDVIPGFCLDISGFHSLLARPFH